MAGVVILGTYELAQGEDVAGAVILGLLVAWEGDRQFRTRRTRDVEGEEWRL